MSNEKNQALLVIDVQVGIARGKDMHAGWPKILGNIVDLIARARERNLPVVFVQHNGGPETCCNRDAMAGHCARNWCAAPCRSALMSPSPRTRTGHGIRRHLMPTRSSIITIACSTSFRPVTPPSPSRRLRPWHFPEWQNPPC
ncbi:MAG: isochorismatase family protein [Betaproteobacteria bacterium]|nr:isochorismatase family protein [Betaproteobacteria bacterium]